MSEVLLVGGKTDNNLAKEQIWEFSNGIYYHEEYYYNNKYNYYEL